MPDKNPIPVSESVSVVRFSYPMDETVLSPLLLSISSTLSMSETLGAE